MIQKLKEFLIKNNFDYFLLPNNDEFFSEYLPKNQKRIEFISGFTGSNAIIIFSQNKNYFFTDGRYILQARQELDLNQFEIINIAEKTPLMWLRDNFKDNNNLAIDPQLLSKKFINECEKYFTKITFLDFNPIDKIWLDRPNKNNHKAFLCSLKLVGEDFLSKRQRILQNLDQDALFISKPENVNWLLNIRGADIEFTPIFLAQALLFKSGELVIFADKNLLLDIDLPNVKIISADKLEDYIAQLAHKNIALKTDFSTTNYAICDIFDRNKINYSHQNCPIEILKAVKNATEINGARKSHEEDAIAIIEFLYWLDESMKKQSPINEISAQEKLLELRKKSPHFLYSSFDTISGFDSNGAIIHYRAREKTNREFNKNSLYLFDSGGQYFGVDFCGTTDITRTFAIGKPSLDMIENYTRVLKGHIALARVKFPRGTSGANLDALARFHLWNAGLDYAHGTGHGVGSFLSVHEGPCSISKNSTYPLQAGMILSNEPGYYEEGKYGIRLENLMLVQEFNEQFLNFEILTLAPFEPDLINFQMLTYPERKWLFDYHNKILGFLENKLSQVKLSWFVNRYIA